MQSSYEKNISYYDKNALRYECSSWYFFNKYKDRTLQDELGRCVQFIGKHHISVLEIGPGTGYLLSKLLNMTGITISYTGIEHSSAMKSILEQRYSSKLNDINVIHASVTAEYIDRHLAGRHFDLIIGSSILHHLPDYDAVVEKLAKLLDFRGVMYFVREPIHKSECLQARIHQEFFNCIYEAINSILMKPLIKNYFWPQKKKQEDAKEIAIHMFKDGVSIKVFSALCNNGFKLVIFRKYNRRVSSFFSFFENSWLKWTRKDIFGNTLFAIGVQKPQMPQRM
ncbi:MAG TPA: class I SAM-dependent methyltransferase [Syntrophorhabdus sp.]|nr:class I SAM-dependent methyltransferase [Syntrophorhabdus sp.]